MASVRAKLSLRSSPRMRPLLDVAVLHRSARCNVVPIDTMIVGIDAIVGHDHLRLAAHADNHRELASNAFVGDRCVGDCRQTFTRDLVHDVEDAKASAVGELADSPMKEGKLESRPQKACNAVFEVLSCSYCAGPRNVRGRPRVAA
jgi:hypothetical protein